MNARERVLAVLMASPKPLPAGDIAKAADILSTTASQILITLWQAGVVTRVDSPDDLRHRVYALSPGGRAMIEGRAA